MSTKSGTALFWLMLGVTCLYKVFAVCPPPDTIQPCICTNRNEDVQIWCTHSDLQQVLKGVQKIGEFVRKPIDELIIENNYLPSLPGKLFQNVIIQRLMLRHNGIERMSSTWLETQEMNLVEIFIVENELKSIPAESLAKLQNAQAITIHSDSLRRIPTFVNNPKLKYISIETESLTSITKQTFSNLPKLERLFIRGSANLHIIEENAFYNLPALHTLEITDCGITHLHMRAFSLLPNLKQLSLSNNEIYDATMVGRAIRDLPMLTLLNLNYNLIDKLNEGAFVDQTMLETLYLSHNNINIIHHGAFHRVPKLRIVDLNYNNIIRIHPESFLQQSSSGVEELSLIGNKIMHISEFRALLGALPRLKFLDMSDNLLEEIPRGAFRGHPSLERLHLNSNSIKFIEGEAFVAMPALRELHLSKNSLGDLNEGPFWNLPSLKGLDLSHNYFQRLQPKLLYNLPSLRRINISNNKLTVIDPLVFIETPLLEYVNVSSNELVSIHPATFRNLANLYELDASSNKLIEFIPGLPRGLEQLNVQRNQITSLPVHPSPDLDLPALRTLDISSNPLICNCAAMWLKSWLLESTSIGPKCADGTYVKGMPFSRNDCLNTPIRNDNLRDCIVHDNEALLPNLATSQVFSSSDKINGYITQEKNNLQVNKINTRPTPEESDYFYDDYVDYPFNETLIDVIGNQNNITKNNEKTQDGTLSPSKINANMKNTSSLNPLTPSNIPRSGFTFFGMPLPSIDMSKFLNTGRKIDWFEKRKQPQMTKYQKPVLEVPKFETGGFTPMLPTTNGGFMPIPSPTMAVPDTTQGTTAKNEHTTNPNIQDIVATEFLPPRPPNRNNTVNSKSKSEIYEAQIFSKHNNATQISYNMTKNMEEHIDSPNLINKYNLMESSLTIEQVTERENIITTDTSNDLSVQAWMESTTSIPFPSPIPATLKPPIRKDILHEPTALSAVLIPSNEELERLEYKRPATITKVNLPHLEHSVSNEYIPINNREPKTRFPQTQINTSTKNEDNKDWYYKNYNKSNLEPYIAPGIHTSNGHLLKYKNSFIYCLALCYFIMFIDFL
ncbi:Insulin-like growth factor-binding protein complex acid labile subunit [Papilio machaon]|uniref:Insulin-like growth factor-binding protein complex acid labile subunit n=1 Tax=Papilio machaon TaxID=76193 RepID=A0A194R7Q0_PAPMA|nr:Insulin-like growth factor-binding protein complex acid labile subunit [Papilio machaon]